jgi:hypothetical protein
MTIKMIIEQCEDGMIKLGFDHVALYVDKGSVADFVETFLRSLPRQAAKDAAKPDGYWREYYHRMLRGGNTPPPKLQIRIFKEGAYYRRRDGNVVGPAILNKNKRSVAGYIWKVGPEVYTSSGEYIAGGASSFDLVCEVTITDVPLTGGDTSVRMTASDEG